MLVIRSGLLISITLGTEVGIIRLIRMAQIGRILTVFLGLALVAIVACSEPASLTPEVTAEIESDLAADALVRACDGECDRFTIYVHDELFTHETLLGEAEPMPQSTIEAIREQLDDVTFVDQVEADALLSDDVLVDGGSGMLLSIGPIEHLAEGVVGIEVGLVTARDGGRGKMVQFQWNGETWIPGTSDDTGVTVTSWVS